MPVITPEKTYSNLKTILAGRDIFPPLKFSELSLLPGKTCSYLISESQYGVVSFSHAVEGETFSTNHYTPNDIAYNIMLRALMKISVTGAVPQYAFVSLGLPDKYREDYMMEIFSGFHIALSETQCEIAGGDIAKSDEIVINTAVYGETEASALVKESPLKKGDSIYISGFPGAAEAGYRILEDESSSKSFIDEVLVKKFHRPRNESSIAHEIVKMYHPYKTAVTIDGILPTLDELVSSFNVGYEIDFNLIPMLDELHEYVKEKNCCIQDLLLRGRFESEMLFIGGEKLEHSDNYIEDRIKLTKIGEITDDGKSILNLK